MTFQIAPPVAAGSASTRQAGSSTPSDPSVAPSKCFAISGRYTHRVAISNARIVTVDDQTVVFRTRGSDTVSLSPTEFIGRFLQHILPSRFVKIRHFGLMSSGNVNTSLEQARALLPAADTGAAAGATADAHDGTHDGDDLPSANRIDPDLPWPALLLALTGQDVLLCPRCQQRTIVRQLPLLCPPLSLQAGANRRWPLAAALATQTLGQSGPMSLRKPLPAPTTTPAVGQQSRRRIGIKPPSRRASVSSNARLRECELRLRLRSTHVNDYFLSAFWSMRFAEGKMALVRTMLHYGAACSYICNPGFCGNEDGSTVLSASLFLNA